MKFDLSIKTPVPQALILPGALVKRETESLLSAFYVGEDGGFVEGLPSILKAAVSIYMVACLLLELSQHLQGKLPLVGGLGRDDLQVLGVEEGLVLFRLPLA